MPTATSRRPPLANGRPFSSTSWSLGAREDIKERKKKYIYTGGTKKGATRLCARCGWRSRRGGGPPNAPSRSDWRWRDVSLSASIDPRRSPSAHPRLSGVRNTKKNKIEKKNRIYHNITECVPPSCRPCPDSSDEFISADRFLTGCFILFDWFSVEFIDVTVCRVDPALPGFQTWVYYRWSFSCRPLLPPFTWSYRNDFLIERPNRTKIHLGIMLGFNSIFRFGIFAWYSWIFHEVFAP